MINSVTRKLMVIAYDKGFSVILDDRFTSHTPSAANPFTKIQLLLMKIGINLNSFHFN